MTPLLTRILKRPTSAQPARKSGSGTEYILDDTRISQCRLILPYVCTPYSGTLEWKKVLILTVFPACSSVHLFIWRHSGLLLRKKPVGRTSVPSLLLPSIITTYTEYMLANYGVRSIIMGRNRSWNRLG